MQWLTSAHSYGVMHTWAVVAVLVLVICNLYNCNLFSPECYLIVVLCFRDAQIMREKQEKKKAAAGGGGGEEGAVGGASASKWHIGQQPSSSPAPARRRLSRPSLCHLTSLKRHPFSWLRFSCCHNACFSIIRSPCHHLPARWEANSALPQSVSWPCVSAKLDICEKNEPAVWPRRAFTPLAGCSPCSKGCDNYGDRHYIDFLKHFPFPPGFGSVLSPHHLITLMLESF